MICNQPRECCRPKEERRKRKEEEERRKGEGRAYGGCPLAVVAGLHPAQERHSVAGLPLQLPEADQFRNELRLLVETHAPYDPIQAGGEREREREREKEEN